MSSFGVLYKYELKKIFSRKLVWVTLIGMILVVPMMFWIVNLSGLVNINGDEISRYEMLMAQKEYANELADRKIDDTLLKEMQQSYQKMMEEDVEFYQAYMIIYDSISQTVGAEAALEVSAQEYYDALAISRERLMENEGLSQAETDWWKVQSEEIQTPFTYDNIFGAVGAWSWFYTAGILSMILVGVGLSNIFAEEHQKKMDSLILCSRIGKKVLYAAKIAAGMTYSLGSGLVMYLAVAIPCFIIYGFTGLGCPVQIYIQNIPYSYTFGEILGISLVIYIIAIVLFSAFAMMGSELFKNAIAVFGIMACGMLVAVMGNISIDQKWISLIYDFLPTNLLAQWNLLEFDLIPWFGGFMTARSFFSVLYFLLAVAMIIIGNQLFKKHQIGK